MSLSYPSLLEVVEDITSSATEMRTAEAGTDENTEAVESGCRPER